jgi:hypothetical protein
VLLERQHGRDVIEIEERCVARDKRSAIDATNEQYALKKEKRNTLMEREMC